MPIWEDFTPMSLLEVDNINTLYGDSHVLFDLSILFNTVKIVILRKGT